MADETPVANPEGKISDKTPADMGDEELMDHITAKLNAGEEFEEAHKELGRRARKNRAEKDRSAAQILYGAAKKPPFSKDIEYK